MGLKRAFGIGALVLAVSTGIIGCAAKTLEKVPQKVELGVGEYKLVGSNYIRYAGMNSKDTFSIAQFSDYAVNLFYPVDEDEINYNGQKFKVIEVTPEHIILEN